MITSNIAFSAKAIDQSRARMKPVRKADAEDVETCFVTIAGMTCASCVDSIQRNMGKVQGMLVVTVSLRSVQFLRHRICFRGITLT